MGHMEQIVKNMVNLKTTLIISLNINGLNAPIESQRLWGWIKTIYQIQVTYIKYKNTNRLKWKKKWEENMSCYH